MRIILNLIVGCALFTITMMFVAVIQFPFGEWALNWSLVGMAAFVIVTFTAIIVLINAELRT